MRIISGRARGTKLYTLGGESTRPTFCLLYTSVIAVNFKADDIDESSNMMDVAMRTIDIMGNKISEESLKNSDYILTVRTDKTGLLDTNKLDSCFEYGYKTVIDNIKDINSILK